MLSGSLCVYARLHDAPHGCLKLRSRFARGNIFLSGEINYTCLLLLSSGDWISNEIKACDRSFMTLPFIILKRTPPSSVMQGAVISQNFTLWWQNCLIWLRIKTLFLVFCYFFQKSVLLNRHVFPNFKEIVSNLSFLFPGIEVFSKNL